MRTSDVHSRSYSWSLNLCRGLSGSGRRRGFNSAPLLHWTLEFKIFILRWGRGAFCHEASSLDLSSYLSSLF